jgi:flagellar biosynthetic protein FliR
MNQLVISEAQLMQFIGQYLWPMLRIGAFYFAIPIIGARTVPARVRIVLTLFTTILLVPLLPPATTISLLSIEAMALIVKEVVIGLALGFALQVVLHVFVLAGQFIALKMGLGFASMNDPSSGVSVTVLSQFYLLLSILLFLSIDGHIVMIRILVDSFTALPLGGGGLSPESFMVIVSMGSWMFNAALVIALPLFTSMLVVNMSFGVMSRSAPQMNVFAVGFPITLVFGLLLMWFGLSNFLPLFGDIIDEGFTWLHNIVDAS